MWQRLFPRLLLRLAAYWPAIIAAWRVARRYVPRLYTVVSKLYRWKVLPRFSAGWDELAEVHTFSVRWLRWRWSFVAPYHAPRYRAVMDEIDQVQIADQKLNGVRRRGDAHEKRYISKQLSPRGEPPF